MVAPRSIQIAAGLRAGDVGDELLCRGFWDALPPAARLDVELIGAVPPEPYDERHTYRTAASSRPDLPGLLVGTSARAETMDADAFLCSVARQLDAFHDAGQPVDALGVGFERPQSREAHEAFRRSFLPIRSWSVVSAHARDVLRELGVPEQRIVVGADWAWSYRPRSHPKAWAESLWRELGVDPGAPLVVVDVSLPKLAPDAPALAVALDRLAAERGFQVAFFDSDTREGHGPDAAQQTMALMTARAVRVPHAMYSPDQVLALLACAATVVSSRRQLALQAVCARTHAIVLAGSEGLAALCAELGVDPVPTGGLEPERLVAAVPQRDLRLSAERLQDARRRMEARSANNLVLWAEASGRGGDPRPLAATIERMSATTWYHRIEIAPGVVTPGQPWEMMWGPILRRHEEADFRGKSVLEVGCWDGYWSFEAERLGAAELLATDDLSQRRLPTRNVLFAAECLGSRVRYLDDVSVYELPERLQRTFDVVIFYGVLYHLRYPLLALAKLRRVLKPGGVLLVETAVLPDEEEPVMRWGYRAVYPEDASTWNAVSLRCLRDMLETSYFEVELCETYMRHAGFGRGYARARAVLRLDPDPHPVPDHFLKDLPTGAEGGGKEAALSADLESRFAGFVEAVRQFELDAISYVPIEQIRKMLFYYEELKSLRDVPGDVVEFGVWRAATLCFLSDANLILDGPNSSRTIIGFDTFSGFPRDEAPARARDSECLHLFADTSLAVVQRKIDDRPGRRLRIVPGHIAETLPRHIETWANRIAMAICDADTASVTRTILDAIWDRMAPGGRIYFDEYSRDGWSETDGVDAFLRERGLPLRMVRRAREGVPIAYLQVD